eukprot:scaffold17718_cov109-Isochrysis_galbana.AAC.2
MSRTRSTEGTYTCTRSTPNTLLPASSAALTPSPTVAASSPSPATGCNPAAGRKGSSCPSRSSAVTGLARSSGSTICKSSRRRSSRTPCLGAKPSPPNELAAPLRPAEKSGSAALPSGQIDSRRWASLSLAEANVMAQSGHPKTPFTPAGAPEIPGEGA